jgi:thymidylate synthase (FAD)
MKAELISVMGDDLHVANCARTSMAKWKTEFDEKDAKLIAYLAREGHWTPFAQPQVCFRLIAPIFVARQWFRHTVGVVRSEVSRRYVDSEPEFYVPSEWRSRPDKSIKQGSGDPLDPQDTVTADLYYGRALDACKESYRHLINLGVAPEQARMVLPQSMMTQWIETGSLAYWARVCTLRIDAHAQAEIRELAKQVATQMKGAFPVSWLELVGNDLDAPGFSS